MAMLINKLKVSAGLGWVSRLGRQLFIILNQTINLIIIFNEIINVGLSQAKLYNIGHFSEINSVAFQFKLTYRIAQLCCL